MSIVERCVVVKEELPEEGVQIDKDGNVSAPNPSLQQVECIDTTDSIKLEVEDEPESLQTSQRCLVASTRSELTTKSFEVITQHSSSDTSLNRNPKRKRASTSDLAVNSDLKARASNSARRVTGDRQEGRFLDHINIDALMPKNPIMMEFCLPSDIRGSLQPSDMVLTEIGSAPDANCFNVEEFPDIAPTLHDDDISTGSTNNLEKDAHTLLKPFDISNSRSYPGSDFEDKHIAKTLQLQNETKGFFSSKLVGTQFVAWRGDDASSKINSCTPFKPSRLGIHIKEKTEQIAPTGSCKIMLQERKTVLSNDDSVSAAVEDSKTYKVATLTTFVETLLKPGVIYLIWSENYSEDLAEAVARNSINAFLCTMDFGAMNATKLSEEHKLFAPVAKIGCSGQVMKLLFFGDCAVPTRCSDAKNCHFRSLTELEAEFAHFAASHGKQFANVVRFDKNENFFYRQLLDELQGEVIVANYF